MKLLDNKSIDTRDIALSVLMDIETNNTFSNIALAKALKKNQFSNKQDRAFISRIVEGTVERLITLDYIINQFSKTKINKTKPLIRCLLRMGTYQIMYMDKVPDSAAVNEAVRLTKRHGFASLSGYVNAVLRNISRKKSDIKYPSEQDKILFLSVRYSMPEWLCEKISEDYPDKCIDILEGCFSSRSTTIRVNESKISKEAMIKLLSDADIKVSEGLYDHKALLIDEYDFIRRLPGYRQGYFTVQDESSMCAVRAAGIKKGDTVIDICAAPGGKTTLAAEYIDGDGKVISMDIAADKLELIEDNVDRLGFNGLVDISVHDATIQKKELTDMADVLIADVPCSGLGIIGRKNDIKYRLSTEQLEELICLQRRILRSSIPYVKPGGTLLFSTCTINPEENEGNVRWILQEYSEFELVEERLFLQGIEKCDGFFYSVLRHR